MDDLNGIDWSKQTSAPKTTTANYHASFSTLKPTPPPSRGPTPLNLSPKPPSTIATPSNDSFSNLVSFSGKNVESKLSLAERQKRIAGAGLATQSTKINTQQDQYAGGDDVWNNLGSGRSTPAPAASTNDMRQNKVVDEEEDLFAAFNAPNTQASSQKSTKINMVQDDSDDPFGLNQIKTQTSQKYGSQKNGIDDDDVLGLLGQPLTGQQVPIEDTQDAVPPTPNGHPQDKAVAELVDMGFPADKARRALGTTQSGIDVQAAVGWLLNQAHTEARERSHQRDGPRQEEAFMAGNRRRGDGQVENQTRPRPSERDDGIEKDPSQIAAELGSQFLKTANSWWKQGSKKVQQAMQEFNSDSETGQSSQPKWMTQDERRPVTRPQERGEEAGTARRRRRTSRDQPGPQTQTATDEAMMLESERPTPPPRPQARSRQEPPFDSSVDTSRDHSPAVPSRLRETHSPQPAFMRQQQNKPSRPAPASRQALSRQTNDDAAAQAYVSSARRRKPAAPAAPASEPDLLTTSSNASAAAPPITTRPIQSMPPKPRSALMPVRPSAPPRNIPSVSAITLKASHAQREKGNESFKRGDYPAAHQAYCASITHLPATHPVMIVLLTNRALTALKIGEPKTAITDCDSAISVIGMAKGESETIDFGNGEAPKQMRDYYGKALMRKAEALEQMEKWTEAAAVWKEAVEGGHGGATSMQGRLRAEKAAQPAASKPKPLVAKKPTTISRPAVRAAPARDSAAVSRLRAANAAAERADDEKFALGDAVDLKVRTWRDGKQDNLRALLGSLDMVLWPEAGWKKISMADLVLPNKVKIQYMKGIGKVHPDKIPTSATTEQRMISASVFSTLNEAWDKFKTENNL